MLQMVYSILINLSAVFCSADKLLEAREYLKSINLPFPSLFMIPFISYSHIFVMSYFYPKFVNGVEELKKKNDQISGFIDDFTNGLCEISKSWGSKSNSWIFDFEYPNFINIILFFASFIILIGLALILMISKFSTTQRLQLHK